MADSWCKSTRGKSSNGKLESRLTLIESFGKRFDQARDIQAMKMLERWAHANKLRACASRARKAWQQMEAEHGG